MMQILGHYNYYIVVVLMMLGFYTVISTGNLIKKLVGLAIFQTAVFILYISVGKILGGTAPIVLESAKPVAYSNPLPHVLILTAIVVGVATTAVGLGLVVRIKESYNSIEEEDIYRQDAES